MLNCSTSGDVGDTVHMAGVMSQIPGGPHAMLVMPCPPNKVTKYRTWEDCQRLVEMISPLMQAQSYISECRLAKEDDVIHWRSQEFRNTGRWCPQVTLLGAHAHNLKTTLGIKVPHGTKKWITVDPSPLSLGRVIVNRTGRYRNDYFPWQEIVNFYGDKLLFVGVPHEYRDFCGQFGAIEYHKTANLLEIAQLVAGSQLFIGNQSCVNAVAEGLKHPLIQETSLNIPDCIFKRHGAQHVHDGSCSLTNFETGEVFVVGSKFRKSYEVNETVVPPGQWQHPSYPPSSVLKLLVERIWVDRKRAEDWNTIRNEVIEYNVKRLPEYFTDPNSGLIFQTVREALKNAPVE